MDEQPKTAPDPTPLPKRQYKRRKKRAAPAKVVKFEPRGEFAGLTAESCCTDCHMDRCVITQKALCAHPRKGGLQPPDMAIPETIARYERAVKALARNELDKAS